MCRSHTNMDTSKILRENHDLFDSIGRVGGERRHGRSDPGAFWLWCSGCGNFRQRRLPRTCGGSRWFWTVPLHPEGCSVAKRLLPGWAATFRSCADALSPYPSGDTFTFERAHGVSDPRPPVLHAVSWLKARRSHSWREHGLEISRGPEEGERDRRFVPAIWRCSATTWIPSDEWPDCWC